MKLDEIRKRARAGAPLAADTPGPDYFWAVPCPDAIAVADMGELIQADLRQRFNTQRVHVRTWLVDNGDGTENVRARVYLNAPPESDDHGLHDAPPEDYVAELLVREPEGSLLYGPIWGTMVSVKKAVME